MQKIVPHLWFNNQAEEAVQFYVSIFKDAKIFHITRYGDAGPGPVGSVMTIEFKLNGERFIALNGGPEFKFNEAISFLVHCDDQEEVNYYWEKLTADGGKQGPCGWLNDKFGLSWQIVPTALNKLLQDPNPEKAQRVMKAMLDMGKLDVAALQQAATGEK
jgi:predicted 3-demethylubiquinone-9 3-methyltransferase (glyoxalase superfamily)